MRKHSSKLIVCSLLVGIIASYGNAFITTPPFRDYLTSYRGLVLDSDIDPNFKNVDASQFKLRASRRDFLFDTSIMTPAVIMTTLVSEPQIANSAGEEGDFLQQAQERMTARTAKRNAERAAKEEEKKAKDKNEFVFASKVEQMQNDIAERKEQAVLFNEQETKRSEENEFIQELKARSAANKEKYKKESMRSDKLSTGQFRSQYDRPRFTGLRKNDGSVQMVSDEDLEMLEKSGRVQVEYEIGLTKDGQEYIDYSKKYLKLIGEDPVPSNSPPAIENEVAEEVKEAVVE